MAIVKLTANPTWVGKVRIPVPGPDGFVELEFEFKHRLKSDMEGFFAAMQDKTAQQAVMTCANKWLNVEEPWTEENVKTFIDNHHAADTLIIQEYVAQLTQQRVGN